MQAFDESSSEGEALDLGDTGSNCSVDTDGGCTGLRNSHRAVRRIPCEAASPTRPPHGCLKGPRDATTPRAFRNRSEPETFQPPHITPPQEDHEAPPSTCSSAGSLVHSTSLMGDVAQVEHTIRRNSLAPDALPPCDAIFDGRDKPQTTPSRKDNTPTRRHQQRPAPFSAGLSDDTADRSPQGRSRTTTPGSSPAPGGSSFLSLPGNSPAESPNSGDLRAERVRSSTLLSPLVALRSLSLGFTTGWKDGKDAKDAAAPRPECGTPPQPGTPTDCLRPMVRTVSVEDVADSTPGHAPSSPSQVLSFCNESDLSKSHNEGSLPDAECGLPGSPRRQSVVKGRKRGISMLKLGEVRGIGFDEVEARGATAMVLPDPVLPRRESRGSKATPASSPGGSSGGGGSVGGRRVSDLLDASTRLDVSLETSVMSVSHVLSSSVVTHAEERLQGDALLLEAESRARGCLAEHEAEVRLQLFHRDLDEMELLHRIAVGQRQSTALSKLHAKFSSGLVSIEAAVSDRAVRELAEVKVYLAQVLEQTRGDCSSLAYLRNTASRLQSKALEV